MIEFLQFAFSPATAAFSVLLSVVLLYWLVVIAGLLDIDWLSIDLDLDTDGEADVGDAGGAFRAMLSFFYLGRVPLTVLVTIMVFSMWALVMLANRMVNPSAGLLLGLPIGVAAVVASVFVVKLLGWPFAKLYGAMHSNPGQLDDVTGKICVLLTGLEEGRTGQAQVNTSGAPVVVNVVGEPGQALSRGSEAVILEYRPAANVYLVASTNLDQPCSPRANVTEN